jgi:hypothetical protein
MRHPDPVSSPLAATATFTSSTETLRVTDNRADGWGQRSYYSSPPIGSGTCVNTTGSGTTKTCDFAIAAGQQFVYRLALTNGGVDIATSSDKYDITS